MKIKLSELVFSIVFASLAGGMILNGDVFVGLLTLPFSLAFATGFLTRHAQEEEEGS